MANTIQIIIEAVDKTKGTLDGVKSYFGDLADTMGDMLVKGAPFINFIQESIGYTIDFHKQVKDLSTTTGMTMDDTSRLIGAASGFGITYGELVSSMETAIKNGQQITTEELGKIADEYKRLGAEDGPVAAAKYLVGKFGTAGFDLAAMFAEGAAGVETAMSDISSYVAINESEDTKFAAYEKELADFNDQLGGFKIAVATEFLPALTDMFDGLNTIMGKYDEINSKFRIVHFNIATMGGLLLGLHDNMENFVVPEIKFAEDLGTYESYRDYMQQILDISGLIVDGYGAIRTKTGEAIEGVIILTEEEWKAKQEAQAIANVYNGMPDEITKTINVDAEFSDAALEAIAMFGTGGGGGKVSIGKLDDGENKRGPGGNAWGGWESANTPYLVGERGPELFVPGTAGKIIPNSQLGGGGGIDIEGLARAIGREVVEGMIQSGYVR